MGSHGTMDSEIRKYTLPFLPSHQLNGVACALEAHIMAGNVDGPIWIVSQNDPLLADLERGIYI